MGAFLEGNASMLRANFIGRPRWLDHDPAPPYAAIGKVRWCYFKMCEASGGKPLK